MNDEQALMTAWQLNTNHSKQAERLLRAFQIVNCSLAPANSALAVGQYKVLSEQWLITLNSDNHLSISKFVVMRFLRYCKRLNHRITLRNGHSITLSFWRSHFASDESIS
jgi:hypothetical protein